MTHPSQRAGSGGGPWWRLKPGLMGLKPFMSDAHVRGAIEAGYGWPRHYEPVCSDCPRMTAPTKDSSHGY